MRARTVAEYLGLLEREGAPARSRRAKVLTLAGCLAFGAACGSLASWLLPAL